MPTSPVKIRPKVLKNPANMAGPGCQVISALLLSLLLVNFPTPADMVEVAVQEYPDVGVTPGWDIFERRAVYTCIRMEGLEVDEIHISQNLLPKDLLAIQVINCPKVIFESGLLNYMTDLKNITVRDADLLLFKSDMFDSRGSGGQNVSIDSIELHNIRDLQVRRYAFRGVSVTTMFYMGEVTITTIVPLAFNFDYVKEFSIMASRIDRISMWGIKLERCDELNVLGMTHFTSLASRAIRARCNKFSMAYNWFGHLHDSSFEVEYGLCDIQGNTFVSFGGKPFLDLKPLRKDKIEEPQDGVMSGFVFRENNFTAQPVLPLASLVMPAFSQILKDTSYIDIDNNQFSCECDSIGWLVAFGQHGYNARYLTSFGEAKGNGSLQFLSQLYNTAGNCLTCDNKECRTGKEKLQDFGERSIIKEEGLLRCENGVVIKNHDNPENTSSPGLLLFKSWKEVEEDFYPSQTKPDQDTRQKGAKESKEATDGQAAESQSTRADSRVSDSTSGVSSIYIPSLTIFTLLTVNLMILFC